MDPTDGTSTGADGVTRCWWCGDDPLYVAYHDREWGKPLRDERALFELLCLEGFQAGLSWITILRKRVAFREAFDGFDPTVVARYGERDVERLLAEPGDRAAPRARSPRRSPTRRPSGRCRRRARRSSRSCGRTRRSPARRRSASASEIPAQTAESAELARELRKWGMRFVGPTTVYAFMQSAGVVDDHLAGCHRAGVAGQVLRKAPRPRRAIPGPVKRPKRSSPTR